MIEITEIYNIKNEYKMFYGLLRYVTNYYKRIDMDIKYLEQDLTETIDKEIKRWQKLEVSPDTIKKLHLYGIRYRHSLFVKGA